MLTVYRHRQSGAVVMGVLGAATLAVIAALVMSPFRGELIAALLVLATALLLFSSLTTEVNGSGVHCYFGGGAIARNVAFADIAAVVVVRNPWYYGWGLRLIPGGWLWNVSGLDAVELRLRDGRRFRIGSDDAPALCAKIEERLEAR